MRGLFENHATVVVSLREGNTEYRLSQNRLHYRSRKVPGGATASDRSKPVGAHRLKQELRHHFVSSGHPKDASGLHLGRLSDFTPPLGRSGRVKAASRGNSRGKTWSGNQILTGTWRSNLGRRAVLSCGHGQCAILGQPGDILSYRVVDLIQNGVMSAPLYEARGGSVQ